MDSFSDIHSQFLIFELQAVIYVYTNLKPLTTDNQSFVNSCPVAVDSCKSVWGCFGSRTSLVKGHIQRRGGGRSLGSPKPTVSVCSPHTSFRGQRWAHSPLRSVEGSLSFPSLSLGLMNKAWSYSGPLCASTSPRRDRRRGTLLKDKGWVSIEGGGPSYCSGMYEIHARMCNITLWCIFRCFLIIFCFIFTWLILVQLLPLIKLKFGQKSLCGFIASAVILRHYQAGDHI